MQAFGDGFDLYTSVNDAVTGYWDSGAFTGTTLVAGRFSGSQAWQQASALNVSLVKSSGANDAVHHIVCAFRQTAVLSGTTLGVYFQLSDGTTNQCCIVFRQDGAILLTSATPAGTVLATYTGAVTAANTWFAFEFEVIISATVGAFRARKNGNTANDFDSGATLNTRPGTNSYANKLTIGMQAAVISQQLDDLLWRSDPSSVPWVGDIRCYTRMPASDAQAQFSKAPATSTFQFSTTTGNTGGPAANIIWWYSIQTPFAGSVTTLYASFANAVTGHVNMAIYDATGPNITLASLGAAANGTPGPGSLLGSATPLTNPGTGIQTFTLTAPVTVAKTQILWVAMIGDASLATAINGPTNTGSLALNFTYSGGAFPASASGWASAGLHNGFAYLGATMTPSNSGLVNEPQQDGTTSYVYDSNVGDNDLYNIAAIAITPASTICVTTRGFAEKSDAGTRGAAVQLKSGGTTVQSTATALATSWSWLYRTDLVDPATGTAWTASGVNNAQIGPRVTS